MTTSSLTHIVAAQKQGRALGITSICSAHPTVLEASFAHAAANDLPLLIESTCNQVNQYGGYTGQTPAEFTAVLRDLAARHGLPGSKLIAGGDHLGPNPWQNEPAAVAMNKARRMVADYVTAGYSKIHLDASMRCADDDRSIPLSTETIAARSADLALVAENTHTALGLASTLQYVIGTEVPTPGGATEAEESLSVTNTADLEETIALSRAAFLARGLDDAWDRVVAVVVQPGVEFGDATLFEFDASAAKSLSRYIEASDTLIYEAHSTDYQTREALAALVAGHFAILKVGPGLTFAFREAVFALAQIEDALFGGQDGRPLSQLQETVEQAMLANPVHWQSHYHGTAAEQALARQYSYSDRIRYYWPDAAVQASLQTLKANLSVGPIPLPLLSQFMPMLYDRVRDGRFENNPQALILGAVEAVLDDYAIATGQLET